MNLTHCTRHGGTLWQLCTCAAIWRPHAGIWPGHKLLRVDTHEGCIIFPHFSGAQVCKWLEQHIPLPHSRGEPPRTQSPTLICSQPAGDEMDSDSCRPYSSDSEEWDAPECGDWSCCLTPFLEGTITWDEIMKESPHRQNKCLVMECDVQESDWELEGLHWNYVGSVLWEWWDHQKCTKFTQSGCASGRYTCPPAQSDTDGDTTWWDIDRGSHGTVEPGCCADTPREWQPWIGIYYPPCAAGVEVRRIRRLNRLQNYQFLKCCAHILNVNSSAFWALVCKYYSSVM